MAKASKTTRKRKKPKEGSEAWIAEQQQNPEYARQVMKDHLISIAQGSKWAVESLERWIKEFPDVARSLTDLGDLCAATESAWVDALAGENPVDKLGVREEVARMKAELLGEKPSILDKILVSNIVTSHLAHQRAVIWAARPAQQQAVATARDKRVESTARWLLLAVKTLALMRQQAGRGLKPQVALKVFEPSV